MLYNVLTSPFYNSKPDRTPVPQDTYSPVHGPLALVVCSIGIVFNLLNILVLCHKDMRSNHINLILAGIAVSAGSVALRSVGLAITTKQTGQYVGSRVQISVIAKVINFFRRKCELNDRVYYNFREFPGIKM